MYHTPSFRKALPFTAFASFRVVASARSFSPSGFVSQSLTITRFASPSAFAST